MKFGVEEVDWFVNRFHAEHLRQPDLRQLRLHRQVHRQCLRRFPARPARHGHAAWSPSGRSTIRFRDWAVYAQDDFKVTPRLTLMYGLR